jgi:hypothetical protein
MTIGVKKMKNTNKKESLLYSIFVRFLAKASMPVHLVPGHAFETKNK